MISDKQAIIARARSASTRKQSKAVGVVGNGQVRTKERSVNTFERIVAIGPAHVVLTMSKSRSVHLTADENILDLITTEVVGGTLYVDSSANFYTETPVLINCSEQSIFSAVTKQGGQTEIVDVNQNSIQLQVKGGGKITTSGFASNVEAVVSGEGSIDCSELNTISADARLHGVGNMIVTCASKISATGAGGGRITVHGNPYSRKINGIKPEQIKFVQQQECRNERA